MREMPQASTRFTPIELLFGRWPRGLLDIAKEAREEQPSPFNSVIEFVQNMQAHINKLAPIVHQHMLDTKAEQSRVHNMSSNQATACSYC